MSEYIYDKTSQQELDALLSFSKSLVIKSEAEAAKYETMAVSKSAFEYIAAVLGQDDKTAAERQAVINSYVEQNQYYIGLKNNYGVDYFTARMAKDYTILYFPTNILDKDSYTRFQELYYANLRYFMAVLYTDSFTDNGLYPNFVRLFIVFMTIEKYITSKMQYSHDVDLYDEYSIDNMFASFGLDFYQDLPTRYRLRILKNINDLLKYKGTDKVIVSILNLFGFDNIDVFKFYMVKDYDLDPNTGERDYSKPDVKFIKVPQGTKQLEKDIMTANSISFESITENDPYWQATKEEILAEEFSIVNTKYISVTSMMDILKETLSMSYIYDMILHVGDQYSLSNSLNFFNNAISPTQMNLVNALVALQILVVKRLGYVDNVISAPSSVQTVYGYNFDVFTQPETFYAKGKANTIPVGDLNKYFIPGYSETTVGGTQKDAIVDFVGLSNVTRDNLVDAFVSNQAYREALEGYIVSVGDYTLYRKLRHLWDIKFTVDGQHSMFNGYSTYSDYLRENDNNLYLYTIIDAADQTTFDQTVNDRILSLAQTIDSFLDSPELDVFLTSNAIATESIKQYLYRLLNIFKSYTIDLIEMEVTYVFNSPLLNLLRYFDEELWFVSFDGVDTVKFTDSYNTFVKFAEKNDSLQTDMYDAFARYMVATYGDTVKFGPEVFSPYGSMKRADAQIDLKDGIGLPHSREQYDNLSTLKDSFTITVTG